MKRKDLHALKKAKLMKMLQGDINMNWNKLYEVMEAQVYPNGTRVVFRMHEYEDTNDVPQTGVIKEYHGFTSDGREIYDVLIEGSDINLRAPIYIISAIKEKT